MNPLTAQGIAHVALIHALTDVERFTRRYVGLTDYQAAAVTLWVAHTHALDAFECTPYVQVTSATFESVKTRLLEVHGIPGGETLADAPNLCRRARAQDRR